MTSISLKQLRYFDSVARNLHFGRAAAACAISQPALSMQVRELEETLGVTLVERGRSGVRLTREGVEIAARAARVLSDVRDLADLARTSGKVLTGPLRLGVIPSIAPYILPPLLPLVRERHAELDLHIRETQTEPLVRELVEGALDVLLLALPIAHPEIATRALFEDRFLLALPRAHRLRRRVRATPDLLSHDRLLLLEEGHCLRDQALALCAPRRAQNIDTFGASSLSTLVQMVANDLGLTLLPEISVDLEARHSKIRLVRFADPQPSRTIGLAFRTTSPRRADFEALGQLIKMARPRLRLRAG